jgi:hypothetical protein
VAAVISIVVIPLSIAAFFAWPLWPGNILAVIQDDWLAGLMGVMTPKNWTGAIVNVQ